MTRPAVESFWLASKKALATWAFFALLSALLLVWLWPSSGWEHFLFISVATLHIRGNPTLFAFHVLCDDGHKLLFRAPQKVGQEVGRHAYLSIMQSRFAPLHGDSRS